MRQTIVFALNGREVEVGPEHAGWMLADFLREQRRLSGTKIVCAEGDCGACTVLKAPALRARAARKSPRFVPVNSCIIPVAQLDGASVVTVDALAKGESLTPVQNAMVQCHGSQCGFCTPGFVMALTGLVEKKLCQKKAGAACSVSIQDAKNATTGNLCRCTGYQPILDAATSIAVNSCESVGERFDSPVVRKRLAAAIRKPVLLAGSEVEFFAPTRLSQLGSFMKKRPGARILGGGTDLGVVHNKRKQRLGAMVSLHLIPELHEVRFKKARAGEQVVVGARVTLTEVREALEKKLPEFARFLDLFASPQIKNQGTLIGNLANASPIGDTSPFLLIAGTTVELFSARTGKRRRVPIEKFFLGYRRTALKAGEVILGVSFEVPRKNELLRLYKVSQRKDLDISTVSAAIRIERAKGARIASARIAFGGVGATPLRYPRTENLLKGRLLREALTPDVMETFHSEMTPMGDLRSSSAFRRVVAENLFRKFFREAEQGSALVPGSQK